MNNENPAAALLIGNLDIHTNLGAQSYRGLKLSFQRRAGTGLSLSGNYTLSRCYGDPAFQTGGFPQIANGYTDPEHPEFDRGPCDQDRTHIGMFTAGVQVPRFDNRALRVALSDWRVSGIFSARSGQPINVIAGQDRAFTGIQNQRVDQVLANPYGDKTAEQLAESRRVRAAGARHAGQLPAQQRAEHRGSARSTWRCRASCPSVRAEIWSSEWRRSTC